MESDLRQRLAWHARFTDETREFFRARGYLEVDTPVLAPFLIPEPSIEVFQTSYVPGRGPERPLWLVPSPELWMKRLIGRGSGDIFQISRSFRNGDFGSPQHAPEFRLLEWYAMDRDETWQVTETEALVARLLAAGLCHGDHQALEPPFQRISIADAFDRWAGIDLASVQDAAALRAACRQAGLEMADDTTWEQAYHIAFLSLVEPRLPRDKPFVLTDYPAQVPTTARRKMGTPWAARWELYVTGVEVANCYAEETDRGSLRRLLEEEARRKEGARVVPVSDLGLAEEFCAGAPPCAGVALGLDRLQMLFRGEKTLQGVILFPFSAILAPQSQTG